MTTKHTPGPWIAGDDQDSDYFLVGPASFDKVVTNPVVKLHNEFNARLIAAAPELLAALREVAQTLAWHQHGECRGFSDYLFSTAAALSMARAAIAKATGETP
jgi:hypothetical protein